jgi:hypothetical protein
MTATLRRPVLGAWLGLLLAAHFFVTPVQADFAQVTSSLSAMASRADPVVPTQASTTCNFDFTSNAPAVTRTYSSQVLCGPGALANIVMELTAFTLVGSVVAKTTPPVNCPGPTVFCKIGDSFFPAAGIYRFHTHYVLTLMPGGTWGAAVGGSMCTGIGTPVLDCQTDRFG